MRRTPVAALAVALAGSLLAGAPGRPASAGHASGPYFDLAKLPPPDYTGTEIFDGLKQFVADYPLRVTGTLKEIQAGQALHQEMAGLGYAVVTRTLSPDQGLDNDQGLGAGLKAIVATKQGTTKPNEWIMFIGHYDTVAAPPFGNPTTIDGAYDNGSGTNLIRFLAHELAEVPTNRSLVFVFYNGEEEGILASDQHARELKAANQKITAVLGFDMVGIAWPVETETSSSCLCIWRGAADAAKFDPLINYVNFTFLGFPNSTRKVKNKGANNRNSDESSFAERGFPTLRWAGMNTPVAYNAYHKTSDTIENIIAVAGEGFYEKGIENTLKSAYFTTMALDNHLPTPAFTRTTSGRTLSFNAAGSADLDAAPTEFSWSFGDGSTGSGMTAGHTYALAGTYQVMLTVTDNLWPAVTRSITVPVTVF